MGSHPQDGRPPLNTALELRALLDPRPADPAQRHPIRNAVSIPFSELAARVHELPPRHVLLEIADCGAIASDALAWMRATGRQARLTASFTFADRTETAGRLWRPNPWLEQVLPSLGPAGTALELGCGSGRDAVFLAAAGWRVTAVDVLPDALERGRSLEARYSPPAAPRIDWRAFDLEVADLVHARSALLGRRRDLICVFRYLNRSLLCDAARTLLPGGQIVSETFTVEHRTRHGRPSRPEHLLDAGEFPRLLHNLKVVEHSEEWRADGSHTARVWAIKPVDGARSHAGERSR